MTPKPETSIGHSAAMTLTRRGFVKAGGALFVSLCIPAGFSRATAAEEPDLARPAPARVVARDPQRQYDSGAHGPRRNRHRHERVLCADDCRGIERPAGMHHADHGRYGQDAGRRLLRRLSVRSGQRSQSCRVHLPGAAADWPQPNSAFPSLRLPSRMGLCRAAERASVTGKLVQGQHLDLKIPVTGIATKIDPAGSNSVAGWIGRAWMASQ